jgi:metal-responsive CopG/Arc/MetJ family transcriptional regulator
MGRKKLWPERLTLPISTEMLERIDAGLREGEARVDLIREAIERELKKRERRS